jgi:hypothetical protein
VHSQGCLFCMLTLVVNLGAATLKGYLQWWCSAALLAVHRTLHSGDGGGYLTATDMADAWWFGVPH